MTCEERFLKYIAVSSASDEESTTSPSSARQFAMSRLLEAEMKELGVSDVRVDDCGNVIGTIPATAGVKSPVVAYIAHMDTSPAASGENIKPRKVVYTGAPIELCPGIKLSEEQFPEMKAVRGQELIVTDGTTLLGADDKAGVAEIMTMAEILLKGDRPHGEIRLVFTTDEEVGRGTEGLDVQELACDWGFTVDGGALGSYEYENFNAAYAKVTIHGVGIHPGSAKNIMKNASTIAMELHSLLPSDQVPEKTEGYEGFIHLTDIKGDTVECVLQYIIRDHDKALFEEKKARLLSAAAEINRLHGDGTAEATVRDTYYNMKEKIMPHEHLIKRMEDAFLACGIQPAAEPIRGGTDGAVLTWKGLPCPNLSTGGYNFHGVHEFIPTESLCRMPEVLLKLEDSFLA